MTSQELASLLDGSPYPFNVPKALQEVARDNNLVVVFGVKDDLLELRGALTDEFPAWQGTTILVTQQGVFDEKACEQHCQYSKAAKREAEAHGRTIRACPFTERMMWHYETEVPHATFLIVQNDEPYCRGIVFCLADVEH